MPIIGWKSWYCSSLCMILWFCSVISVKKMLEIWKLISYYKDIILSNYLNNSLVYLFHHGKFELFCQNLFYVYRKFVFILTTLGEICQKLKFLQFEEIKNILISRVKIQFMFLTSKQRKNNHRPPSFCTRCKTLCCHIHKCLQQYLQHKFL